MVKGLKQYEKFRRGEQLSFKQAILAQCYVCNGEIEGGRIRRMGGINERVKGFLESWPVVRQNLDKLLEEGEGDGQDTGIEPGENG